MNPRVMSQRQMSRRGGKMQTAAQTAARRANMAKAREALKGRPPTPKQLRARRKNGKRAAFVARMRRESAERGQEIVGCVMAGLPVSADLLGGRRRGR